VGAVPVGLLPTLPRSRCAPSEAGHPCWGRRAPALGLLRAEAPARPARPCGAWRPTRRSAARAAPRGRRRASRIARRASHPRARAAAGGRGGRPAAAGRRARRARRPRLPPRRPAAAWRPPARGALDGSVTAARRRGRAPDRAPRERPRRRPPRRPRFAPTPPPPLQTPHPSTQHHAGRPRPALAHARLVLPPLSRQGRDPALGLPAHLPPRRLRRHQGQLGRPQGERRGEGGGGEEIARFAASADPFPSSPP